MPVAIEGAALGLPMIANTRSAVHAHLAVQLPAVMLAQLLNVNINADIAWPNTPRKTGPLISPFRHSG